jgi:dTDP-glucose 4,6-dehydratase
MRADSQTRGLERYSGATVAVFGASGFIGRWVARQLGQRGARLHLVVRDRGSAERVREGYGLRGEFSELDLLDARALDAWFDRIRPQITFNLVAYGVRAAQRDEGTSQRINSDFVEILADAVERVRSQAWTGQHLVHVGSALEYGDVGGNLDEQTTVANPQTVYGKTKLSGTLRLSERSRASGLRAMTARLFTVYGPGEPEGRLLPQLIELARSDRAIDLTAGTQRRDFTYVEDVAEGLLRLGLANGPSGAVINLATGRLTSVREFAETAARWLRISPDRLKFGTIPLRAEEMVHDDVCIDRLRNQIGWFPSTTLDDGLRRTLDFLRIHVPRESEGVVRATATAGNADG